MSFLDQFTGRAQRGHIQGGLNAANAGLGNQVGALNNANAQYQAGFQPYLQGGQQDYATYRNALANGTGGAGGFDEQYFGNGALQRSRQLDLMRTQRRSNAGGNFQTGAGELADSRVNQDYYQTARNDWLNREKGMVDLGYGAAGASGAGYLNTGNALANAYGQNAQIQYQGGKDLAGADNTLVQNAIGATAAVGSFYGGRGGGGNNNGGGNNSSSSWGNNLGRSFIPPFG